jgi:LAO/AO transport system kinase
VARLAFPASGRAGVVGLTGSPGVGKSSLAAALVALLRRADERVAVLAVDPSSPLSGGAVLGDRVRMQAHAGDPGVFVRSMASRGAPGGLAPAAFDAVRLLDAAGWPWVLVETVGVGQAEADVRLVAETVVVVVAPGGGDGIQAVKAGIYEIADVFVVNKADRPGADEARGHLERMLDLVPARGWRPPVVATTAVSREGVDDLWAAVRRHRAWLTQGGRREARRAARLTAEVRHVALARAGHAGAERCRGPAFDEVVARVVAGRLDPSSAADALLG